MSVTWGNDGNLYATGIREMDSTELEDLRIASEMVNENEDLALARNRKGIIAGRDANREEYRFSTLEDRKAKLNQGDRHTRYCVFGQDASDGIAPPDRTKSGHSIAPKRGTARYRLRELLGAVGWLLHKSQGAGLLDSPQGIEVQAVLSQSPEFLAGVFETATGRVEGACGMDMRAYGAGIARSVGEDLCQPPQAVYGLLRDCQGEIERRKEGGAQEEPGLSVEEQVEMELEADRLFAALDLEDERRAKALEERSRILEI